MTGSMVLSSKCPCWPEMATVTSFPRTWAQTMTIISDMTVGDDQFAEPAAGARAEPPDVLGDLGEAHRYGAQRAARLHHGVLSGQGLEEIGRLHQGEARLLRELGDDGFREPRLGVEARPHRRAAQCQLAERMLAALDAPDAISYLLGIAGKLLAQPDGHGILQVRPADLDDGVEGAGFLVQRIAQQLKGGQEILAEGLQRGQVDHRGHHIVTRLAAVHMVVWVHGNFGAHRAAKDLDGPVGDDLVGVHVGGGPRPRLEDIHGELAVQFTVNHLGGAGYDGLGDLCFQSAPAEVHERRRALHPAEGVDHPWGNRAAADGEVLHRALSLRPPQRLRRHFHLAHGIFFDPEVSHGSLLKRDACCVRKATGSRERRGGSRTNQPPRQQTR